MWPLQWGCLGCWVSRPPLRATPHRHCLVPEAAAKRKLISHNIM